MSPDEEAAALWGSAENEAYPDSVRLSMALQALEYYGQKTDTIRSRVQAMHTAEVTVLHTALSRQERACRKAARDAYGLVLELLNEAEEET